MTDNTAFQVIRDAIIKASTDRPQTDEPGGRRDTFHEGDADHYARAVLVALEHNGFEIVRHTPEPPDDD